jgi:Kef-type K+ transport system membrane component KefB
MNFGILAVIVLAGLGGPLLGLLDRHFVPVVVGEILAGILVGPAVLKIVDPHQPTVSFLSEVGFAMLMLTVGMHLPLRDKRLAAALRGGGLLAALVGVLAVPAGLLAGEISGAGHAAVYAVVLASGSAAVLLPAIQESGLGGTEVLTVMAQVTIADVLTIVSVPIVLQPSRTWHTVLGTLLVAGAVVALRLAALPLRGRAWVDRVRQLSKQRHWALDLRLSLLVVFALAWLAQRGGTSILIAGFGAGVMVALIGGPKRLSTQVRGVAEGFFVPLFFVVLGAQLNLGGLFGDPAMVGLAAALVGLNVLIHLLAAVAARKSVPAGLAATAQLGVPAAVAALGLSEHLISAVIATAIVASALASLAFCSVGVELLGRREAAGIGGAGSGASGPPGELQTTAGAGVSPGSGTSAAR